MKKQAVTEMALKVIAVVYLLPLILAEGHGGLQHQDQTKRVEHVDHGGPGGELLLSGRQGREKKTDDRLRREAEDGSGWALWSPWAPCSRTCGEGVQARRRLCLSPLEGCHGSDVAWKACALKSCPSGAITWRDEQCALQNNRALDGKYHLWTSIELSDSRCSLDCHPIGSPSLVHRFANTVEDGTSCGDSGLQLCLAGVCEEIGCDLQLRSSARLDQCGVCGGDGASCQGGRYLWHQEHLSRCSASCGGGERMVEHLCKDSQTERVVNDGLCDLQARPNNSFIACNEAPCPSRWEVSEYTACKSKCSGLRTRRVECVSDVNGQRVVVEESRCPGSRPASEKPCTTRDCPVWYTGSWSGCSATCGPGTQKRNVECRNVTGQLSPSSECGGARPPDTQQCSGSCREPSRRPEQPNGWTRLENGLDDHDDVDEDEAFDEENYDSALDHTVLKQVDAVDDVEHMRVSPNPNFIVDQWSPCSASCGEGIRFRKVECKIFLEFSKTVASLPDKECPGLKPPETDLCVERHSCSGGEHVLADQVNIVGETLQGLNGPEMLPLLAEQSEKEASYAWKIAGFTTCTASCLGGLQESIVICVETEKENPVAPYFCDPHKRLEIEVRTCNENPCPPRWNVSDFSECGKSCGGGTQTRSVQCIQEVAHGGNNIISLGKNSCPQPPPRAQQFCNVIDCPVQWQASSWTKCSRKCGGGSKYRKVRCQQLLSLGQMIDKDEVLCEGERPHNEEQCNLDKCVYTDNPEIKANVDQDYMQTDPYLKVVKVKVGGRATVYVGTTLKVRCPVKQYDKRQITWARGNIMFHSGKKRARHSKVSVSGKGGLKIKTIGFEDSGIYTCMASKSRAQIEVFVKGVEAHLTTTEATRKVPNGRQTWSKDHFGRGGLRNTKDDHRDLRKYSKGKGLSGNEVGHLPFDEKPIKKEKWNLHEQEDELMDDFVYWDSIGGHVEDQARPANRQNGVLTFVPWGEEGGGPRSATKKKTRGGSKNEALGQRKRIGEERRRKRRRQRKRGKKGGAVLTSEHALMWAPGSWSLCSRSCGGGEQRRRLACTIKLTERNITQEVPSSFCKKAGLRRPARKQECALVECPTWRRSPWSPCSRADCMSRDTGLRTRTVHCIQNHTVVDEKLCDNAVRPADSQPCHNTECSGIWVLGEWSRCSVTCGGGTQQRSVSCEWLRGGLAPSQECGKDARPASTINCFGAPCRSLWDESDLGFEVQPQIVVSASRDGRETSPCQDTSKFCGLIKTYKMCEGVKFKEECCLTCRNL